MKESLRLGRDLFLLDKREAIRERPELLPLQRDHVAGLEPLPVDHGEAGLADVASTRRPRDVVERLLVRENRVAHGKPVRQMIDAGTARERIEPPITVAVQPSDDGG